MSLKVEIFSSPGCQKCRHARQVLAAMAEQIGGGRIQWQEVDILEQLDRAVSLGVLSAPAIAINGRLEFSRLPSAARLRARLEALLVEQDT